jgi:hypothetical protein
MLDQRYVRALGDVNVSSAHCTGNDDVSRGVREEFNGLLNERRGQ